MVALKAMKNAGFHQDVNVVLQFDPYTQDTPTHIFEVNMMNKIANESERKRQPDKLRYEFWESNDPYVRDLVLDKLWNDNDRERPARERVLNHIKTRFPNVEVEPPIPTTKRSKMCFKRPKARKQQAVPPIRDNR